MTGFPTTSYWKELKGTITVVDPKNPSFLNARPPTVPEEDTYVPPNKKFNFKEVIDVPVFWQQQKFLSLQGMVNQRLMVLRRSQ